MYVIIFHYIVYLHFYYSYKIQVLTKIKLQEENILGKSRLQTKIQSFSYGKSPARQTKGINLLLVLFWYVNKPPRFNKEFL